MTNMQQFVQGDVYRSDVSYLLGAAKGHPSADARSASAAIASARPTQPMPGSRERILIDVSRSLCELVDLENLISFVIDHVRELMVTEHVSVLLLDASGSADFDLYSTPDPYITVDKHLSKIRVAVDNGIDGWIAGSKIAATLPDGLTDRWWLSPLDTGSGIATRSRLRVPLRARAGLIGGIELRNKLDGTFSEDDLRFVDALSGGIAIAIENARLHAHVKDSEARLRTQIASLRHDLAARDTHHDIIGNTPEMRRLYRLVDSASTTSIPVLIQGEPGAGKGLVARLIHRCSAGADEPFITVNCGALPEPLLESQLFGHRKGALAGATRDHTGIFEAAENGTVFLDEVGEMPLRLQARLLHVLQENEVVPVGGTTARKVTARVLSATNRDLPADVKHGRFRQDLYDQLAALPITVPPLRTHRADIPLLATHFLAQSRQRLQRNVAAIAPDALDTLMRYDWPGNIRELQNMMERAVALLGTTEVITTDQLMPFGAAPQVDESHPSTGERERSEGYALTPPGNRTAATTFVKEGELWRVSFESQTVHFKKARGFALIAYLLSYPGRQIHAIDLLEATDGKAVERIASDAGEILDGATKKAYKARLRELHEELAEYESFADIGRSERLREEIDFLTQELSRAIGLGGRSRRAGSITERSRVNVTRAIALAIKKISEHHKPLAKHLKRTLHTGTFCHYAPDPRAPIDWTTSF